jgi:hypothetical protein
MARLRLERWLRVAVVLVLGGFACGPSAQSGDGSSDGGVGEGEGTTSTTGASGTGMMLADSSGTTAIGSSGETFAETFDATGCGFLCPPDATHPESQCDPVAQDCVEGEKCVWYVAAPGLGRRDAARCIPVTGDGQPFEPCMLPTGFGPGITDDCGAESYCLEVYGTADHGFCAPFVQGARYGCDAYPGASAAIENGSDFPAACLHYECQPLVEGSCPEGMQCTFYPAFLYGTNMCWFVPPEAELPLGAACDFGECGEGALCVPGEWAPGCREERCCTQWCDLNAPSCDDPAAACELFPVWGGDGDPDFEWLGACVVPGSFD